MTDPETPIPRNGEATARRRAVSVFAQADARFLEDAWKRLCGDREIAPLRGPETGLVMVRGRAGGGGAPFNLGEASVTRASVRIGGDSVGHAMVLGRDLERAKFAAAFDALWQIETERQSIETQVVAVVEAAMAEQDGQRRAETEATRVDFFTLMRGED
ncbi:phosphonate C-P lyase system protein PhnG [Jiella mangrovi]|uniref:Phosphonate C-P lyase system protein PhnG n=1 Tax=Jiella mangrovi TaxID=2821407 RepID=A0ABS4BN62_9HYPH|nr:phosphonate C-P lyase system protein PhnG [Jiella mangrovi]MBP0618115.1 phosphonate C-P lyase system protein PhnG [Jiella mangrovi]